MNLANDTGCHSGRAKPSLHDTPYRNIEETNGRRSTYLLPITVQTNRTTSIASLELNADWVILSACNTAAGDGSEGAPGLSGLARSFFFAGASSLLASHWPVRDDVAPLITVNAVKFEKEEGLSRGEALQRAMQDIRIDPRADSDTDTWAHPSVWAPFSLIGEAK